MLHNIKQGCCVAGVCDLVTQPQEIKETLELLVKFLGLPDGELTWISIKDKEYFHVKDVK